MTDRTNANTIIDLLMAEATLPNPVLKREVSDAREGLMRHRRKKPDTRLDWRDPDMPVVRRPWVEMGFGRFERRTQLMTPDESQELAIESFEASEGADWRNDPTYNLGRGQRRRRR